MRNAVTRREFLACALGVGASLLAGDAVSGGALTSLMQQSNLFASSNVNLPDLFMHKESARAVGGAYLSTYKAEANERTLLALISANVFGPAASSVSATEHEVKQLVQQSIMRDFETDKIVQVHGWILSVTEARLCALTAVT